MQPSINFQCKAIIDKVDVKNREELQKLIDKMSEFQTWIEQQKQCLVQAHQFEYGEIITDYSAVSNTVESSTCENSGEISADTNEVNDEQPS